MFLKPANVGGFGILVLEVMFPLESLISSPWSCETCASKVAILLYIVTILSLGRVTLTQIVLYVRVDKENLLESLLIGLATYMQIGIY